MIWLKKLTKWWRCGRSINPIISTNRKLGMNDVIPTISTTVPPHVPCMGKSVDKQDVAAVDLSTIPSITSVNNHSTQLQRNGSNLLNLQKIIIFTPLPPVTPVTPVWLFFNVGCLRGITHLQLGVLNHPSLGARFLKAQPAVKGDHTLDRVSYGCKSEVSLHVFLTNQLVLARMWPAALWYRCQMGRGVKIHESWISTDLSLSINECFFRGPPWVGKGFVSVPLTPASELVFSWPAPVIFFYTWILFCWGSIPARNWSSGGANNRDMCVYIYICIYAMQCKEIWCNATWCRVIPNGISKCSKHLLENLGKTSSLSSPKWNKNGIHTWIQHPPRFKSPRFRPLQSQPTTFCQVVGGPWNEPDMQQSSCCGFFWRGQCFGLIEKSWGAHTHLAGYWVFSWLLTWVLNVNELSLSWLKRWKRILIHY